ncbi:MAG: dephospho-CoA kinase [Alphaproteobacteria bacterium]|nr:dephospho-CoA kinase [Alphaproteobacteria bacterium]
MILIGLTGSIGMGKSETARLFLKEGVAVYDADAAVHQLYEKGGAAVAPIAAAFPEAVVAGAVARPILGQQVLGDGDKIKKLEAIVHPLAAQAQRDFLAAQDKAGAKCVVLDIPLLFETGGQARVDVVVVVDAPALVQAARVLARADMTAEKLEQIRARQMPNAQKCALADFVVDTSRSIEDAHRQVRALLLEIKNQIK